METPIKAFQDQDQAAHITVHQQFMVDPRFGGNPEAMKILYAPMMAHLGQHMAFLYQQQMQAQSPQAPISSGEYNKELQDKKSKEVPIQQENLIAAAAAQAAQRLMQQQPPNPEQQKQDVDTQVKLGGLELKKKDLDIREQRFKAGQQKEERVQNRQDALAKADVVEKAARVVQKQEKKK